MSSTTKIGARVRINNECFLTDYIGRTGEVVDYLNDWAVTVKLDLGSNRADGTITVLSTSLELE